MRKICVVIAAISMMACARSVGPSVERVQEICAHIPNPEHLETSRAFLTNDFYAALEAMISRPDSTPVLHEWEFWFVAADGSPVASCNTEVQSTTAQDDTHVRIGVMVQPPDADYEAEEHTLVLEKVGDVWLLADYDAYKAAAQMRANQ